MSASFEEILSKKAEDFQIQPSSQVWKNIASDIAQSSGTATPKTSWSLLKFVNLLIIPIGVMIGAGFYFKSTYPAAPTQNATKQNEPIELVNSNSIDKNQTALNVGQTDSTVVNKRSRKERREEEAEVKNKVENGLKKNKTPPTNMFFDTHAK